MSKQDLAAEITQLVAEHQAAYDECCTTDWSALRLKTGNPRIMEDTIKVLKVMESHINEKIKEYEKL